MIEWINQSVNDKSIYIAQIRQSRNALSADSVRDKMFSVALQMYPVKYLVSEVQQGDCSMKRDRNSFWCVEQTVGTDQQITDQRLQK